VPVGEWLPAFRTAVLPSRSGRGSHFFDSLILKTKTLQHDVTFLPYTNPPTSQTVTEHDLTSELLRWQKGSDNIDVTAVTVTVTYMRQRSPNYLS
jgi:hypothetical protein